MSDNQDPRITFTSALEKKKTFDYRGSGAEVIASGKDEEIIIHFDQFEIRADGIIDYQNRKENIETKKDPSKDSAPVVIAHVSKGLIITQDGVINLAAGIYLITHSRFCWVAELGFEGRISLEE